jgi:molecular chaperone DnaK
MAKIIGIDFGTTKCCVSAFIAKTPKLIENTEGMRATPAIVVLTDEGERRSAPFSRSSASSAVAMTIR